MFNFAIIAAGLIAGVLLFWKLPELRLPANTNELPKISVIIPMRNEACNIAQLLIDLKQQTFRPSEVICVDDESTDGSAAIARELGAFILAVTEKPKDWLGKSFACQLGAQKAVNEVLVFLDADVRLAPTALSALVSMHAKQGCTVSAQPYHSVKSIYEHFSLFPNIVQVASIGFGLPFPVKTFAFFGPVLVIARETYGRLGGHTAVKDQVLEDLMLGRHYASNNVPSILFTGRHLISFRMYPGGSRQLWQGWTKNMFGGASSIPLPLLLMVVMMVAAYSTAVYVCMVSVSTGDIGWGIASALSYILCAAQIQMNGRKTGNFHPLGAVLYPLLLMGFIVMFVASAYKKLVLKRTKWKGRDIRL